jgi:ElaB/YqjD/DUF883 family membrane-anchored ribosome-binding protein
MFARLTGRRRAQAHRAAQVLNDAPGLVAREEVGLLISTVEDLIERLSVAADPELKRLRQQTVNALEAAKNVAVQGGAQVRDQAGELARQSEIYISKRPWTSLGLVALGILAIGLWTGRSVTTE